MQPWYVWPRRPREFGLARASDRLQALLTTLLVAAGFAMVVVAVSWAGSVTEDLRGEHPAIARGEYSASAVVTGRSAALVIPVSGDAPMWSVPLRWSDHSQPRTGRVILDHPVATGGSVDVVVDAAGLPRPARCMGNPVLSGWMVGVISLLTGWTVLLVLWAGVEQLFARYHAARWAAEWERVEPTWSGRAPSA
jgi:hypothetical protein